ncbi:MAG: hypothetical protein EPN30_00790 [Actinomycetota bacterium]|nr:MAG: hypothetical protein EPN30_00790 [Actinomycetota bacterium]
MRREVITSVSFVTTIAVEFPRARAGSGGLIEPTDVFDCVAFDTFTEFDSRLIELPNIPVEAGAVTKGIWGMLDVSARLFGTFSDGDTVTALVLPLALEGEYALFVLANEVALVPSKAPPRPTIPKKLLSTINHLTRRNLKLLIIAGNPSISQG